MCVSDLAFDSMALIILGLIVLWYIVDKRIPLLSRKIYFGMVLTIFTSCLLEIIAMNVVRASGNHEDIFYVVVLSVQQLTMNLIPILFAYYISVVVNNDARVNKMLSIACFFTAFLVAIVVCLNPMLKWMFESTPSGIERGGAAVVLLIVDLLLVAYSILSIFKNRSKVEFKHSIMVTISIGMCICAIVFQHFTKLPVVCFAVACACLMVYHYLNNVGTITDATTLLYNRNFMGSYLNYEFSTGKKFNIIAVAMDDFKFINKTYGVNTGDSLLQQVGGYLSELSGVEAVFRFGSDQFCLFLRKKSKDIDKVTEDIHNRFLHPWYSESSAAIMMSASICCIDCPKDAKTYESLIEVIDYSMIMAKKTRKGGVVRSSELDIDNFINDKAIEKAVKLAMDRDELMVHYQPIYSVEKQKYNSAEALVRLKDEELGWISPEKFIPIAEKNGLIMEMGDMILKKVCKFIRDYSIADTDIEYIEINISPVQLTQLDFATRVIKILENYGVKPEQINFEITETASLGTMAVLNDNIGRLVDYGIAFSLDDYGSGHSNIDYINHMPFKIIKIDKCIIWDAFKNEKAGITLEYTIGMLNALKLLIVAEGVETEEMRDKLENIGCHYMQGWYYSKAVPDTEFMELISSTPQ